MLSNLPDHLRGIVKVPLKSLEPLDSGTLPKAFLNGATAPDLEQFLANPNQQVCGIINQKTLDSITSKVSIQQLRGSLESPSSTPCVDTKIQCLLSKECIEKSRTLLGSDFRCNIRIHCIPSGCTDGYVYRMIHQQCRLNNISRADEWLWKLKGRKPHHMVMILGRPGIRKALDAVVPFTGLWDSFHLGNWAKHLAAHLDPFVISYWQHILRVWSCIFEATEADPGSLDSYTVRCLEYKAPFWSKHDREEIRAAMLDGVLFANISSPSCRLRLLENILKSKTVIPSIRTFDENMRFITIAAKILEKHFRSKKRKRQSDESNRISLTGRSPEDLFSNLESIWTSSRAVEVSEGKFADHRETPSPASSFVQLLLVALRNFPFLSQESPLRDCKDAGMIAYPHADHVQRLCTTGQILGFACAQQFDSRSVVEHSDDSQAELSIKNHHWRGGKPTISQFWTMRNNFFIQKLACVDTDVQTDRPNILFMQKDFLSAFFGSFKALDIDTASDIDVSMPVTPFDSLGPEVDALMSENPPRVGGLTVPEADKHARRQRKEINLLKPSRKDKTIQRTNRDKDKELKRTLLRVPDPSAPRRKAGDAMTIDTDAPPIDISQHEDATVTEMLDEELHRPLPTTSESQGIISIGPTPQTPTTMERRDTHQGSDLMRRADGRERNHSASPDRARLQRRDQRRQDDIRRERNRSASPDRAPRPVRDQRRQDDIRRERNRSASPDRAPRLPVRDPGGEDRRDKRKLDALLSGDKPRTRSKALLGSSADQASGNRDIDTSTRSGDKDAPTVTGNHSANQTQLDTQRITEEDSDSDAFFIPDTNHVGEPQLQVAPEHVPE